MGGAAISSENGSPLRSEHGSGTDNCDPERHRCDWSVQCGAKSRLIVTIVEANGNVTNVRGERHRARGVDRRIERQLPFTITPSARHAKVAR